MTWDESWKGIPLTSEQTHLLTCGVWWGWEPSVSLTACVISAPSVGLGLQGLCLILGLGLLGLGLMVWAFKASAFGPGRQGLCRCG